MPDLPSVDDFIEQENARRRGEDAPSDSTGDPSADTNGSAVEDFIDRENGRGEADTDD
jgi:hypothetical protein